MLDVQRRIIIVGVLVAVAVALMWSAAMSKVEPVGVYRENVPRRWGTGTFSYWSGGTSPEGHAAQRAKANQAYGLLAFLVISATIVLALASGVEADTKGDAVRSSGAGPSAAAKREQRPLGRVVRPVDGEDAAVASRVSLALRTAEVPDTVEVHVSKGRVTLTGHLYGDAGIDHILEVCRKVAGVAGVTDRVVHGVGGRVDSVSASGTGALPDERQPPDGHNRPQAHDTERYDGGLKDGRMHGQGTYYAPDGGRYEGEFRDGARHGQGTYYWPSGARYKGEWKAGKMHGRGTGYGADGTILRGRWEDDRWVGPS